VKDELFSTMGAKAKEKVQDQSTFLSLKYILKSILLTHQTISWIKKTKQSIIFLEPNLSKAFDKVD
jgi:hypothetical protein